MRVAGAAGGLNAVVTLVLNLDRLVTAIAPKHPAIWVHTDAFAGQG